MHDVDVDILKPLLKYLVLRSDLLSRSDTQFVRIHRDGLFQQQDCQLGLYLGAYGRNLDQLAEILRDSAKGEPLVDRKKYALAFAQLNRPGFPELPNILSQIGVNHLIDIGCGPGALLVSLASRDPTFVCGRLVSVE